MTAILNGESDDWSRPSLTLIRISTYSPTAEDDGVPERRPVEALNEAQAGRLTMVKFSGLRSGSDATGVNEYRWPAMTDDGGVPEIVGAVLAGGGDGVFQQNSRPPSEKQFRFDASATVTNARTDANNAIAAQVRAADAEVAFFLKWQPRYRGH